MARSEYDVDRVERLETVTIDDDQWVQLEFGRRWPKYVVAWSVRRRSDDSDYPVASGVAEAMPRRVGDTEETDPWDSAREQAVKAAMATLSSAPQTTEEKPSLLARLFRRRS
ncbi:MAG: hypothetical protein DLM70_08855 [Chloroflexi bacterium]|nr:MAG: hypothetical protein DLM70_08855 [Chloroflexota bacterium]